MPRAHTYYDNLKVARNAPDSVIRAAYRALAQQYHPDKNPGSAEAAHVMKLLNEAYAVLSDPKKRLEHDAWIASEEGEAQRHAGTDSEHRQRTPDSRTQRATPTEQSAARPYPRQNLKPLIWFAGLVFVGMLFNDLFTPNRRVAREVAPGTTLTSLPTQALPAEPARPAQTYRVADGAPARPDERQPAPRGIKPTTLTTPEPWGAGDELVEPEKGQPLFRPTTRPSAAVRGPWDEYGASADSEGGRINLATAKSAGDVVPAARTQSKSSKVPNADQFLDAADPSVQWSPNGKPWPTRAGYLKAMPPLRATGGLSKLTIDNTNGGSHAYVKLCRPSQKKCDGLRHIFVPDGASFTMTELAAGAYEIRYRDLKTGAASKSEAMTLRQIEDDRGVRFSVVRLTLYRVADGNTSFTSVPEENF